MELSDQNKFRFVILENENRIKCLHRTVVVNETGYLNGIYVDESAKGNHPLLIYKLTKFALDDLNSLNVKYIKSLVYPNSPKEKILHSFGFEFSKKVWCLKTNIYDSLRNHICNYYSSNINLIDNFSPLKNKSDYFNIVNFDWSNWSLFENKSQYINWCMYGNTIDILSCVSDKEMDCFFDAIMNILCYCIKNSEMKLSRCRINLPNTAIKTYLKLLKIGFVSDKIALNEIIKKVN